MDWSSANDAVRRSLEANGESLVIDLTHGTLCAPGRITSSDEELELDEGVALQRVLVLQMAWSDAKQLVEGNIVERIEKVPHTRHPVIAIRQRNEANGLVTLKFEL